MDTITVMTGGYGFTGTLITFVTNNSWQTSSQ